MIPHCYGILRYGFVNVGRAPVAPRNGSAALRWPIVIFQVLSRRSFADCLASVNFVRRFSSGEVHLQCVTGPLGLGLRMGFIGMPE